MTSRQSHMVMAGSGSNSAVNKRVAGQYGMPEEDVFVDIEDEVEDAMHQQQHQVVSNQRGRRVYRTAINPSADMPGTSASSSSPVQLHRIRPHVLQSHPPLEHHHMLLQNEFETTLATHPDDDPSGIVDMGGIEGYMDEDEYFFDDEEETFIGNSNISDFELLGDSFRMYDQGPQNIFVCELCGERPMFTTRDQYNAHRYERHANIVSVCACPDIDCDQVAASIGSIKKHLSVEHNLPLESHYRKFDNITDFSEWIVFIQYETGTRFIMHNRQQPKRRQLLFCVFSDHRKSNQRPTGMLKSKGCCPAHVNYSINQDGTVEVIYQMFHHGHNPKAAVEIENMKPWSLAKANRENRYKLSFPSKPLVTGCRPMQYIQVDIIDMPETKYRMGSKYSNALIVTDMYSKFMFGRSLIDGDENDQERVVCRLVTEIFYAFGLPEGYSSIFGKEVVDRCFCQISENFRIDIQCVTTSTPCYAALRRNIELRAEADFKDRLRWPESLPATILTHNQTPHAVFQFRVSPFEVMFGRKAWYKTNADVELPWMLPDRYDNPLGDNDLCPSEQIVSSSRQHDPNMPIYDSCGKPLPDPLKTRILKTISLVEARCDRWQEQGLTSSDPTGAISSTELYKKLGVRQAFMPGDLVYVRGLNIPCEKGSFHRGMIAEVNWEPCTQFPYRVHVETNNPKRDVGEDQFGPVEGMWPTEDSPSFWLSAYDVSSSSMELGIKRQPHYDLKDSALYCSCSQECSLFKSENCSNEMSKTCCDLSGKRCLYHELYDPKNVPVDKFVENYSQNPEKMVRRVANRRGNIIKESSGGQVDTNSQAKKGLSEPGVRSNGQTYQEKHEIEIPSGTASTSTGVHDGVVQPSSSKKHRHFVDELDKERERFHAMDKELNEAERKLVKLKSHDERPSEEYLLMESDVQTLRDEWNRLKKFIDVRDQQKKFKRMLENSPNPSSTSATKRRNLRSLNVTEPAEFTRQTRLIVEDNQIFPIVSVVNPNGSVETGTNIEMDTAAEFQSDFKQDSTSADPADIGGEQIPSSRSAVTSTQRSGARGILSRRGPAKSVARSIQNSIEITFVYTTAGQSQPPQIVSSTSETEEKSESLFKVPAGSAPQREPSRVQIGSGSSDIDATSPVTTNKASPITSNQANVSLNEVNSVFDLLDDNPTSPESKKRAIEATEPSRRSARIPKKSKMSEEQ
ncbi:zinc finger, C2H2 type [Ditylenchus destructor]|nr:zinc finger, C2H2 type [Ditylenchus destructor]